MPGSRCLKRGSLCWRGWRTYAHFTILSGEAGGSPRAMASTYSMPGDLPPNCILPRQACAACVVEADKELGIRAIRAGCTGHTHRSALVRIVAEFSRKILIFGTACASACRVASLRHKTAYYPVKYDIVVKPSVASALILSTCLGLCRALAL